MTEIERLSASTLKAEAEAGRDEPAAAASQNCSDDSGSLQPTGCCGYVCHAAIAHALVVIGLLPIAVNAPPSLQGPSDLAGPIVQFKRPPRPLASVVG